MATPSPGSFMCSTTGGRGQGRDRCLLGEGERKRRLVSLPGKSEPKGQLSPQLILRKDPLRGKRALLSYLWSVKRILFLLRALRFSQVRKLRCFSRNGKWAVPGMPRLVQEPTPPCHQRGVV